MVSVFLLIGSSVVLAYIVDFRMLREDGQLRQWVSYGATFLVACGLIALGVMLNEEMSVVSYLQQVLKPGAEVIMQWYPKLQK